MQKAFYLFLLLFVSKIIFAQENLPAIKAKSTSVDIRVDDDYFAKGGWTLDPTKKPDIFSIGSKWLYETKKVTFTTDIDSISFNVQPNSKYNFVILLNEKTPCYIQIATLSNPIFMQAKIVIPLLLGFILIFYCNFCNAQTQMQQPQIFAEGIISTGDYETHPAFSPTGDTLYFLKCLPDANFCSICVSYKKDNGWLTPQVVSFSGKYSDADPFVTKDGNTIYFVSNRPVNEDDSAKGDWDIWKTERNTSGWRKPIHLDSPINSSGSEFFPTLADNGNLYFGSSREGGKGKSDIYFSKFQNEKYAPPQNLGDSLNTPDNEYEPFIAPDESYLVFMATYPNGIAHADFYISYNSNGKWSKAKKLVEPINSSATEWGGKVTRDGKYFFFGSSRNKIINVLPQQENTQQYEKRLHSAGNGLGDIYYIDISALGLKNY